MSLLEKHLKVKRSVIPKAGKGLFTTMPIAKGSRIVEYKGKIVSWKQVKQDKDDNRYILYVKRDHVIDAKPYKKAIARYANDAHGFTKQKGLNNNSVYVEDGMRVYIEATKNIPAGSEILVDYGRDYWNNLKENLTNGM